MNSLKTFLLIGTLVVVSSPALSQGHGSSQGQEAAAGQSVTATQLDGVKVPAQRSVTIPEGQVRQFRSAPPKLKASGFGIATWSADGKVERTDAPASVVEALKSMAPTAPSQAPAGKPKAGKLDPAGIEPIAAGDGDQSELMIGSDDRVMINDTTKYPFSTFVHIITEFPDGTFFGCTGTVIGLHHVLTAANCVFDYNTNAWPQAIDVYPGRSGDNGPFGGYKAVGLAVPDGFSEAPKGTYDNNRLLYDMAVLSFDDPIGTTTGWLAFGFDDGLPPIVGNLIGYPKDKDYTMWRSSCDIDPKQIEPNLFEHYCDIEVTNGAAMYQYVKNTNQRTIYGVQVGDNSKANYALRITGPWFDWINAIRDAQ